MRPVRRPDGVCVTDGASRGPSIAASAAGPDLSAAVANLKERFGVRIDGVSRRGLVSWALACVDIDAAVAGGTQPRL